MNGFLHHLQYGDALTGAGIGLAKIRVEDGLLVNLYVSHYHAEYNRDLKLLLGQIEYRNNYFLGKQDLYLPRYASIRCS